MVGENYLPNWLSRGGFERAEREGHRLWLSRRHAGDEEQRERALWVMCNPNTADERVSDNTISRVRSISQRNYGACDVGVVNLFTRRKTNQAQLDCGDAESNYSNADEVLRRAFQEHETIVFAWGAGSGRWRKQNLAAYKRRAEEVEQMAGEAGREPLCLGVTKCLFPRHPARLATDAPLVPLREARARRAAG